MPIIEKWIQGHTIFPNSIPLDRVQGLVTSRPTTSRPVNPETDDPYDYTMPPPAFNVDLIMDGAIEGIKLAVGAVDLESATVVGDLAADRIAAGTISADVIWGGTIGTDQLVAGSALIGDALIGSLSADKITAGQVTALVELSSPVVRYGKTTFEATTAGFWLGRYPYLNPTGYGFHIGGATASLKWDSATGDLTVVGGTITGGVLQTAATGKRVVVEGVNDDYTAEVKLYSGAVYETYPANLKAWANLNPEASSGAASIFITSPSVNSKVASMLQLVGESGDGRVAGQATLRCAPWTHFRFGADPEDGHTVLRMYNLSTYHGVGLKALTGSDTLQIRNFADDDYAVLIAGIVSAAQSVRIYGTGSYSSEYVTLYWDGAANILKADHYGTVKNIMTW